MVPTADNEVAFEIQGEGKIIGMDNGNLASHEDFKGATARRSMGCSWRLCNRRPKRGGIQLTATSPGLKSGSVTITTKA